VSDGAPTPRAPTLDDFPASGTNALASFGQRAWARILDTLLLYVPLALVAATLAFDVDHPERTPELGDLTWLPIAWVLLAGTYDIVLVATTGTTVGKVALGTRVARYADGERPTWDQAALRALLPLVAVALVWALFDEPLLGAVAVYLTALASELGRGWHDRAGGTVVVRTR
jgi:uncharacterized RDD family membrane protein YckC